MYYTPGRHQLQFAGTHTDQCDTPWSTTDLHGCFKYPQIFQGGTLRSIPLQVTYPTLSKFHNNKHYGPLLDWTLVLRILISTAPHLLLTNHDCGSARNS